MRSTFATLYLVIVGIVCILILFVPYKFFNKNEDTIEGLGLNNFTGRLAIDDQYYYDKLFDDVFYYPNDDPFSKYMTTGYEKCKSECTGNCVSFGPSAHAYCFPY